MLASPAPSLLTLQPGGAPGYVVLEGGEKLIQKTLRGDSDPFKKKTNRKKEPGQKPRLEAGKQSPTSLYRHPDKV